jgi:hypothetical protein
LKGLKSLETNINKHQKKEAKMTKIITKAKAMDKINLCFAAIGVIIVIAFIVNAVTLGIREI